MGVVKEAKARSSPASKKMRLRPEPLHAPRAARQHARPAAPKAPCPHANSRPCGQGAGDCGPSPGPPPLSCCMTSTSACPGTGSIFSILSAILYLGNVTYKKKATGRDEGLEVGPPAALDTLSQLLKVLAPVLSHSGHRGPELPSLNALL